MEETKENTNTEVPQPRVKGAYTIFPACGCGCKKEVKVANALVKAVGDADWFRSRHHPTFRNQTVSFRSKEEEKKND